MQCMGKMFKPAEHRNEATKSIVSYSKQISTGADPGFSERGSENFMKGVWSAAPEAIGIYIVEHQNHTL